MPEKDVTGSSTPAKKKGSKTTKNETKATPKNGTAVASPPKTPAPAAETKATPTTPVIGATPSTEGMTDLEVLQQLLGGIDGKVSAEDALKAARTDKRTAKKTATDDLNRSIESARTCDPKDAAAHLKTIVAAQDEIAKVAEHHDAIISDLKAAAKEGRTAYSVSVDTAREHLGQLELFTN